MATPAMAALLWLGHFPPLSVTVVGIITAFAGYTAIYALNDLVDYRTDRERLALDSIEDNPFDVDQIMVRHPVAQGMLSFGNGAAWFLFWSITAIMGAWWLNPLCAAIFFASALMEAVYCRLLKITHLKVIPSAMVKASGGIAGVYAVDPNPSLLFIIFLVLWLSAWEVGGQNVANDIVDMTDDAKVDAKTTATVKGLTESVFILVSAISMAAFAGMAIYWLTAHNFGLVYPIGAAILSWTLLLKPAREVYRKPNKLSAALLFNRASYMPPAFLILIVVSILIGKS
jgi:4-hydroxybenzoate polyprenyltransferase